jgi:hypothetical protein
MNGAAACFAACLAVFASFSRRNSRRRLMFSLMFGCFCPVLQAEFQAPPDV